jgi:hypothetical protein
MTPLESTLLRELARARGLTVAQATVVYVAEEVPAHDEIDGAAA